MQQYSKEYVIYETQKRLNRIKSYRLHHCCSHLPSEFEHMYHWILASGKDVTNTGILKYTNAVYWGGLRAGKENGYGIIIYESGGFYMGMFRNGNRNGEGFLIETDGDLYKAEFVDDKLNGSGCVFYRNINVEVDGIFVNDSLSKVNTASDSFEYTQKGKGKMIYNHNTGSYNKENSGCGGLIILAIIVFIIFKCCS